MFIGHYGAGLAGKSVDKTPSLGTLFLAAQWLDLLWPIFVLSGLEKVSIAPGNTAMVPLNFEYYPWSHSLLMAIVWGVIGGGLYFNVTRKGKAAWLIGALVLSHWVLDWISHGPDLPLTPFGTDRVGLGLWNHPWAAIALETGLFVLGLVLYLRKTKAKNRTGSWSLWILVIFLLVIHFMNSFGPPPPSVKAIAWTGLSQWIFVAWGYWIDRNRS